MAWTACALGGGHGARLASTDLDRSTARTRATSSDGENGFVMKSSAPRSAACDRNRASSVPLTMMIGNAIRFGNERSACVAWSPFVLGISTSMTITSKAPVWASLIACCPSATTTTSKPAPLSAAAISALITTSSSATSTRRKSGTSLKTRSSLDFTSV